MPSCSITLFGGDVRYTRNRAAAESAFVAACESHKAAEAARQQRVADARRAHAQRQSAANNEAAKHNAAIDAFAAAVRAGDRHAVSRYFQIVIDQIRDPQGFPRKRLAGYVPESTLLAIEWRLPAPTIVPAEQAFKWIKSRDEITQTARSATEIRQTYQTLVAQIALRALHAVFSADRLSLATTVVFNGIVDAIDPSTGQPIKPCLITLRATQEQFAPLVLKQLDPVAYIRKYFAADVSPHPEELHAVPPVMEFRMADPRIIDPVDVISQIDKRPNLLELSPKEFEYFVHNLFDRMGFDTKIFKADGDGGVDCVAYDPTPIRGGKYVIQAKLYNKTVPPTAVRDLYGTMQHEGAQSGILITTSGFGPSSYEFANGKPLQLIDGSGLLALCQDYNIPARIVRIAKEVKPARRAEAHWVHGRPGYRRRYGRTSASPPVLARPKLLYLREDSMITATVRQLGAQPMNGWPEPAVVAAYLRSTHLKVACGRDTIVITGDPPVPTPGCPQQRPPTRTARNVNGCSGG